jgi:hypothetical protein
MKLFSRFSTKTLPIHYVWSETHVLGGFAPFGSSKCSLAKSFSGMPFWHEFGLTKLLLSFLAKMDPIHYFWSKTHILGGFAPFGCCKCTVAKSGPKMLFWHEFRPTKLFSRFSTKTLPIHYVRSETQVLGGYAPFVCRKCTVAKSVPRMLFWHEFRPTKLFSSFSAKMHPIHYIRSKTHVLCDFAPFGCCKHTFAKFVLGCRFGTSLGRRNYYRVFQPKRIQSTNLDPKLMFWGGFAPFGCCQCTLAKSDLGMPFWHEFGPTKLLSSF